MIQANSGTTGTVEQRGQWAGSAKARGAKRQRNKRNQTEVPKRQQMKMPNNVGRKERRRQAQSELEQQELELDLTSSIRQAGKADA